jgi:hypothetical protein
MELTLETWEVFEERVGEDIGGCQARARRGGRVVSRWYILWWEVTGIFLVEEHWRFVPCVGVVVVVVVM